MGEIEKKVEEIKQEFLDDLVEVDFRYIKCKTKDYLACYFFNNENINKKFIQLYHRYNKIWDWNMIFSVCCEIAIKTIQNFEIYDKDKKYIKTDDDIRKKLTTAIVFNIDKQIINYIDDWTSAIRIRKKGEKDKVISPDTALSFEYESEREEVNEEVIKDKLELNAQQLENYGKYCKYTGMYHLDTSDTETQRNIEFFFEHENTRNKQLEHIAELVETETTKTQKKVLRALAITNDNQSDASEILNCSQQNISNRRRDAKKRVEDKIENVYAKSRAEKIRLLNDFLDNIEDEKDVIQFVLSNINEDYIDYILTEIKGDLRRHFIINFIQKYNENILHTEMTRKFCRYFLKEVYEYIELLKYNNNIKLKPLEPTYPEKQNKDRNGKVKRYLKYDRLPENARTGGYIIIDNEKYYLIDEYKAKILETQTIYEKGA